MELDDLEEKIRQAKEIGVRGWLLKELNKAFMDARKGKLKTYDQHAFEQNLMANLVRLRDSILEFRYEPSPSVAFVIFKPMVREIFAAPFRDRVIHHFLFNMQAKWWDKRLIYDSYSCRTGKGTLFGIRRAQTFMRRASQNCTRNAYVMQFDIKGYFMSLPREKLYEAVKWGLDQQFMKYEGDGVAHQIYLFCEFLWRKIIFDDPARKAHRRGPIANWEPYILPPEKSLFTQPPGRGIVIGNLTSQLISNIYLDRLDRYIKFTLGYEYYGRYVDDFFIMVPEEEYAGLKKDARKIKDFLESELDLKLHEKKRYVQNVNKGMFFLGARIYPYCLYPSDRLQHNFRRAVTEFSYNYRELETIISYLGIMKHLDADRFIDEVFEEMGWRR
ncbi:MAG: RNA-directed DNA polymerase [Candidatus Saccharibacteria bacterium]|nr:RNA-directed DNA polymerase [Candidatus Saccharibacteria bacterium]